MQTLGLSDSTPRTEGRLKALLWPSIRNDGDFDYITGQGFWVCFVVGSFGLILSLFLHQYLLGGLEALFYLTAAMRVTQRSRGAAICAFTAYLLGALVIQRFTGQGFGILRIVFLALLLSNIRGSWIASKWQKTTDLPMRLNQTFFDKISDQLPARLWRVGKWFFAFLAALEIFWPLVLLTTPVPPGPRL